MPSFYLKIGGAAGDVGELKFGFHAPPDVYDNIGDELGVTKIGGNADRKGIVFGANKPRPPRVRITYGKRGSEDKTDETQGSAIRFCDGDKLNSVLNGSINDKKIKIRQGAKSVEKDILSVSVA